MGCTFVDSDGGTGGWVHLTPSHLLLFSKRIAHTPQDNWRQVAAASKATFDAFTAFYQGLLDAIQRLSLNRGDFGGLLDVDFNNFLVPPGDFLDGVGIVYGLPALPTLDNMWAAVRPAVDMAVGNITLASVNTTLRALQWAQALEASLAVMDVTPADYDPPRYVGGDGGASSVEAEVAAHDAMADTFVARTATSLDSFDSYSQYVGSNAGSNVSQANTSLGLDNLPSFDFSFNLKVSQTVGGCMCIVFFFV